MMTFYKSTIIGSIYQDPSAGDNSTCALLPDPSSSEGAWLARLCRFMQRRSDTSTSIRLKLVTCNMILLLKLARYQELSL